MYTVDCKDPDCVECGQASGGKFSEEENRCQASKTVDENLAKESEEKLWMRMEQMLRKNQAYSFMSKRKCLSRFKKLKEEVHHQMNSLFNILRDREQELCTQIEEELYAQLHQIDKEVAANCIYPYTGFDEFQVPPFFFHSDFQDLKKRLEGFGQLLNGDNEEHFEKFHHVMRGPKAIDDPASLHSDSPMNSVATSKENPVLVSSTIPSERETLFKNATEKKKNIAAIYNMLGNLKSNLGNDKQYEDYRINWDKSMKELKESLGGPWKYKTYDGADSLYSEKYGEDNSSGKKECRVKMHCQQSAGCFNRTETLAGQIKKRFDNLARKMEADMAKLDCQIKDTMPDENDGEDCSLKRRVENLSIKMEEDTANEKCESADSLPGERVKEDGSLKKRCPDFHIYLATKSTEDAKILNERFIQKTYDCAPPLKPAEKDLLETLRVLTEIPIDIKRNKIRCKNSESVDLSANEESNNNSLEKDIENTLMLWANKPEMGLNSDKIGYRSSGSTDLSVSEEAEKDNSLDEDDIEIISRNEAAGIPSDASYSPPLPPKNRFKFGGKPSCFSISLRKKRKAKAPLSPESESCQSSSSSASSVGTAEMKEEVSSAISHSVSKDDGQGDRPSAALRCSFTKYLEKNPESQWLSPDKSSEQPLPAGSSCMEIDAPSSRQDLGQWLNPESNQRVNSDWLCPGQK